MSIEPQPNEPTNIGELDDETIRTLLGEARSGNEVAVSQLFDLVRPELLQQAEKNLGSTIKAKLASSDIVQESLIRASQGITEFQGNSLGEFRAWIASITEHRTIDAARYFRAAKRDVSNEAPLVCDPAGFQRTGSSIVAANEERVRLLAAIEELEEDLQTIVKLRYLEIRSFDEISEIVQCPRETVRRKWARAIDQLSDQLDSNN